MSEYSHLWAIGYDSVGRADEVRQEIQGSAGKGDMGCDPRQDTRAGGNRIEDKRRPGVSFELPARTDYASRARGGMGVVPWAAWRRLPMGWTNTSAGTSPQSKLCCRAV